MVLFGWGSKRHSLTAGLRIGAYEDDWAPGVDGYLREAVVVGHVCLAARAGDASSQQLQVWAVVPRGMPGALMGLLAGYGGAELRHVNRRTRDEPSRSPTCYRSWGRQMERHKVGTMERAGRTD